jgi:ribosomal 30S subunit maturation factor RimM
LNIYLKIVFINTGSVIRKKKKINRSREKKSISLILKSENLNDPTVITRILGIIIYVQKKTFKDRQNKEMYGNSLLRFEYIKYFF